MAKLNTDFVLIDESVVMYGFRSLMRGAELDGFKANPIMLTMHARASNSITGLDTAALPIGKWYDIRTEGGRLLAKPDFDDNDPLAVTIQKKVEGGYLNAASIWIDPIEVSDDDADKLPGQYGVTITRWGLFEASIVDIPACRGALAIRTAAGTKVQLSGSKADPEVLSYLNSFLPQQTDMDKKLFAANLGLPETATDAEIITKLTALKASEVTALNLGAEVTKLKGDVVDARAQLTAAKTAAEEKDRTDLVDGAIAQRKIGADTREHWVKLATADLAATKALFDGMKGATSLETALSAGSSGAAAIGSAVELNELLKLSGEELYMSDKLERLQTLSPEHFKLKYKEYFGTDYSGK